MNSCCYGWYRVDEFMLLWMVSCGWIHVVMDGIVWMNSCCYEWYRVDEFMLLWMVSCGWIHVVMNGIVWMNSCCYEWYRVDEFMLLWMISCGWIHVVMNGIVWMNSCCYEWYHVDETRLLRVKGKVMSAGIPAWDRRTSGFLKHPGHQPLRIHAVALMEFHYFSKAMILQHKYLIIFKQTSLRKLCYFVISTAKLADLINNCLLMSIVWFDDSDGAPTTVVVLIFVFLLKGSFTLPKDANDWQVVPVDAVVLELFAAAQHPPLSATMFVSSVGVVALCHCCSSIQHLYDEQS